MSPPLVSSLATLPDFLAYFATAIAFATLFVVVYIGITPQRELALIRANTPAAAISFGGAFIGFVIPLASAIAHSVGLIDCGIWSAMVSLAPPGGHGTRIRTGFTGYCCAPAIPAIAQQRMKDEG